MAYRSAEQEAWGDMKQVVGIEIRRSATPYPCPLCQSLAGRYPKDFKWNGWHPNCRCYMVPILVSDDEFFEMLDNEDYDPTTSENYVGDVPEGFSDWVDENSERIMGAVGRGSAPYFVKDNLQEVFGQMDYVPMDGIERVIASESGAETQNIFQTSSGAYSEGRARLHEQIISEYIGDNSSQSDVVYMLGGAPANGKSTLVDSGMLKFPKGSLVVDADKVKSMIPEYAEMVASKDADMVGKAAAFVHEESSTIGKLIQERAFKKDLSVVIDGVNDGSFEKVEARLNWIRERNKGKRVRADYVTLDTDLSVKLAEARAKKTGRRVPMKVILDGNKGIAEVVPQLIEHSSFDELYLWDTNINGKPRLILRQIDGKLEILDRKLYNAFLKKAK